MTLGVKKITFEAAQFDALLAEAGGTLDGLASHIRNVSGVSDLVFDTLKANGTKRELLFRSDTFPGHDPCGCRAQEWTNWNRSEA